MIIRQPIIGAQGSHGLESICGQCLSALRRSTTSQTLAQRNFGSSSSRQSIQYGSQPQRLRKGYFLSNGILPRPLATTRGKTSTATTFTAHLPPIPPKDELSPLTATTPAEDLPHRRRQKRKQQGAANAVEAAESASDSKPVLTAPDAASVYTTEATQTTSAWKRVALAAFALSKPRLSFLIVLTTTSAYSLYPVTEILTPSSLTTPSLSALTLLFLTGGTALTCASANAFNMLYEPKWDAMMSRTRNRPLVRGLISPGAALFFAIVAGATGCSLLYYGVNPTVSGLAGANIFLYAGVYTPLKRISVLNTWAGALVGGIPPLMGWAAAAGQVATGEGDWKELLLGEKNYGGWLLAGLLVAWQFPHFMALSWGIRHEYKAAGYKMLAWMNPARNGRVALRYSLAMVPLSLGLCYVGTTEWTFAVASMVPNAWMIREAWRFHKYEGLKGSARGLFWASVWHLPAIMVLAMLEKKGMWQRVYRSVVGVPDDDEEWEVIDDEEVAASIASGTPLSVMEKK